MLSKLSKTLFLQDAFLQTDHLQRILFIPVKSLEHFGVKKLFAEQAQVISRKSH